MKKIVSVVSAILTLVWSQPAFALNDTIGVTAGSGKTANLIAFPGGNVISEAGICDATAENRCAVVSAGGALSVSAVLGAETTKVIGTVNQGTSPWVTSTTLNAETTKVIGTVNQGTSPWVTSATQSGNWTSRIVGNTGAVLDFAGQNAASPANAQLIGGQFNTTPTTITSGNSSPFQLDNAGNLLVNVKAGGGSGGTSSSFGATFPATGTAVGMSQGGNMVALTGTLGFLNVNSGQAGPWEVQADAGVNLNTSALALESGGNLAGLKTVLGAQSDAACSTANGTCTLIALTKKNNLDTEGVGTVQGNVNVTPTNCSISVMTGGTAQDILGTSATRHGFTIANVDATTGGGEPVWISFTGTADAGAAGSFPLPAPTATTYNNAGSFSTPFGFGGNTIVSVKTATASHVISCFYW